MNHRKYTTPIAAALAMLSITAVAYAATGGEQSHTFGRPGAAPELSASCQRLPMDITPWGRVWASPHSGVRTGKAAVSQAFSVVDAELKCEHRRITRIMHCWTRPVPPVAGRFDHGAGRPGDWSGVDQLEAYVAGVRACTLAVVGSRS